MSYARRTSALSLYNASPTARAQRSSQSYKDPGLLATRKNMYTNDGSAAGATQAKSDESSSYHMGSHACEAPSTGCVAEVNQVELPSDAGWANLVEPPDNSKSEDAPRKQTTKYGTDLACELAYPCKPLYVSDTNHDQSSVSGSHMRAAAILGLSHIASAASFQTLQLTAFYFHNVTNHAEEPVAPVTSPSAQTSSLPCK